MNIQDPESFLHLEDTIAKIESDIRDKGKSRIKVEFARPPTWLALEVAIDATSNPKAGNPATRHDKFRLVAGMAHRLADPASDYRRIASTKGTGRSMAGLSLARTVELMSAGGNAYTGHQDTTRWGEADPVSMHGYFATTDRGSLILDPLQHSARTEVRIQGSALPGDSLAHLAEFRFQTLAKHLYIRSEMEGQEERAGCGQYARMNIKRATHKGGGTRQFMTAADSELNAIFKKCLENLSRKWA